MARPIVMVVGASGTLGGHIAEALIARGAHVRAMVRATSDRRRLEAMGVADFVVADLGDHASLHRAMAQAPRADAVIASAAGFTAHAARTKGNDRGVDVEGYRQLIDATRAAGVGRFVLISILHCDRAPGLPHFREKWAAEQHLVAAGQPYLSLRAGAFIDRAHDIVPDRIRKGSFPDILPGVPMSLIYSRDLARYAAQAALDVPEDALNQRVDVGSDRAATGESVAAAFTRVLGRPIVARPVFPRLVFTLLPLLARFMPGLRDNLAVMRWLRGGGYVSDAMEKQQALFGDLPGVDEIVARYSRDKGLA